MQTVSVSDASKVNDIRADWLRTYHRGIVSRGGEAPCLEPGSEPYERASKCAEQIVAATSVA